MQIKVKKLDGVREEVNVDEDAMVTELCTMLAESAGVAPSQIRLIYKGAPLQLNKTLRELNVVAGDNIHMIIQLRGGSL